MNRDKKHKHLTLSDRIQIEQGLCAGESIKAVSERLGKHPTTLSKEIKRGRISVRHNCFNEFPNKCGRYGVCAAKRICGANCGSRGKLCKNCDFCNSRCPEFTEISHACDKLKAAPYVCNGCEGRARCRLDKFEYRAKDAEAKYRHTLVSSREGINLTPEELERIDSIVSPLIDQGQTPYLISAGHPELGVSERTIYKYIDANLLHARNIDLPKKVKYKKRRVHKSAPKDKGVYVGRTYEDFCRFIAASPALCVVEMDTVAGCMGTDAALLTLYRRDIGLQLYYWMPQHTAENVKHVFDWLEDRLGAEKFREVFPIILTDRGSEFARPSELETGLDGKGRTRIFFCDAMASWQKGGCEKNHEFLRKILPKKSSFESLGGNAIRLVMNHINSTKRASRNDKTPYELARFILGEEAVKALGLAEIQQDEVCLTPQLLKRVK